MWKCIRVYLASASVFVLIGCGGSSTRSITAVLHDVSRSTRSGCDGVVGLAEAAMARPKPGLYFFSTGDITTANEPVPARITPFLPAVTISAGSPALGRERSKFRRQVAEWCENLNQTESSPLYLGVKTVIDHLRTLKQPETDVYLDVQTDLEETVESGLKAALAQTTGPHVPSLPPVIDNSGIRVSFCGYSETYGVVVTSSGRLSRHLTKPRYATSTAHLRQVWGRMFTDAASVQFEPFCPAPPAKHD